VSQKWYQSKCTNFGLAVLLACQMNLAHAAHSKSKTKSAPATSPSPSLKELPQLLQEVEDKYTKLSTISAEFTQTNDDATTSKKKKSSGKIFVKRPSKIRWETLQPYNSLLVSDGRTYWYYTPPFDEGERGQVVEKKSSQIQSRLANALLAGSFSIARDMAIKQKSSSTFVLIPKPGSAGTVTQAVIEIDPDKKLIQKVILDHKGGNHSEISLSKIELGHPLEDDFFVFHAPANTDKVEDQE
jgi:outer membrane lipoprotein carrier protein